MQTAQLTGGELLRRWQKSVPWSLEEVAEKFGISRSALSQLRNDHFTPSLGVAVRIQEVTEGAVPVEAWAVKSAEKGAA